MQNKDPELEQYKNRKATYIPRAIAKEFIEDFYKEITQGHNGATGLVLRL